MQSAGEGQPEVPAGLRQFVAADWRDENERRPSHVSEADWPQLRTIGAYKRFLAARRAWEAQTGVHIVRSWERWAADCRSKARSIGEVNVPYSAENFVEREEQDPRWEEG